jgi:hypothetical protein
LIKFVYEVKQAPIAKEIPRDLEFNPGKQLCRLSWHAAANTASLVMAIAKP